MTGQPVFLIGFMGSGKSTLGHAVSEAAGISFTDLDYFIEAGAGMSVPEIFGRYGEPEFRHLEREALRRVAATPQLIACGGGTPCQPGNMELMNDTGITVWLEAPVEKLVERLLLYPGNRPLIAGKSASELRQYVADTLKERSRHYSKARFRFDASRLDTPGELAESTAKFIDIYLKGTTL